jgi:hypothetical protein
MPAPVLRCENKFSDAACAENLLFRLDCIVHSVWSCLHTLLLVPPHCWRLDMMNHAVPSIRRVSKALLILLLTAIVLNLTSVVGLLHRKVHVQRFAAIRAPIVNQVHTLQPTGQLRRSLLPPLQFKTSNNDLVDSVTVVTDDDDDADGDPSHEQSGSDAVEVYPSPVLGVLAKAVVPFSASLGFALNPSKKLVFRLSTAAVGGLLGIAARQAIRSQAKIPEPPFDDGRFGGTGGGADGVPAAVTRALDQLTSGKMASLTVPKIESVARSCHVPERQLSLLFTTLFTELILQSLNSPSMDLTELVDVIRFAENNKLTQSEVGDGLALAAARLGKSLDRDERGFYEESFPESALQQAAKLLFLADKMVGVEEGYYGRRMLPALSFFTLEMYQQVVTEACKDLFRRCVEGVLVAPRNYQSGEVEELKTYLTVSPTVSELRPAVMQHMILEAIQFMLNRTLPASAAPMEAAVEGYDTFLEAQPILGWARSEWIETLEARTMPLFEAALRKLFKQVADAPARASELAQVLEERMQALKVDPVKARVLVTSLMSERNKEYMTRIDRVYNASGGAVDPAYKIMVSYAHVHEALRTLAAPVMQGAALPMPGLPFPDLVRANMYQAQLSKSGGKDGSAVGVHADMFALTPEQRQAVRKHLAMPKIASWVKQCIDQSNFSPNARKAYEKELNTYDITPAEWAATSIDFYYQDALKVSQGRAVPSQEDMDRLLALREFLNCNPTSVGQVHLELFGSKYVKALTESMTPTGVITDEYVDGLQRLRQRLSLQEADAENLFAMAARARIGPIVKDLVDIWKSDTDANYRREKERQGGNAAETGGRVFMREALNLVDFLSENHKLLDGDASPLENPHVNAGGMANATDLVGMFKHYVVSRLTEQDFALARRYRGVEVLFGRILGIATEGQVRIKESLAYSVYKNMLLEVLRRGDVVDVRATAQFVQLRDQLELSREAADRIMKEATRGALVEHAARLIRATAGGQPLTAEAARLLRSQVSAPSYNDCAVLKICLFATQ